MPLPRPLRLALLGLAPTLALLLVLIYGLAWRPAAREAAAIACAAQAPVLQPGQALKVMTWNVRYLGSGQHDPGYDPARALENVLRVLREEQADIVLLQELQGGGAQQDQLARLQSHLSELYPCSSQTPYWKAGLVAPLHAGGSAELKLATLSRYRLNRAERLQLPRKPANPLQQPFQAQRALLVSYLAVRGGGQLAVVNSQLDSAAEGADTQRRQVAMTARLLQRLQRQGTPWLLGVDLNPLRPEQQPRPAVNSRGDAAGELARLASRYPMIPSLEQASGPQQAAWHTHFAKDGHEAGAGSTLDYLLHSPRLTPLDAQVRQHDTRDIAGHLPLLARLLLPALD
ncbi:endonuclease/exonuclease/phosphatase family protein [Pseudomonas sp. MBLB4136]|uniref:endonuclease/exonuclease/phosphatase family protein n=1 Tax=Pseudomonas sp. MBLB4136 TaxID=3451558 RepID=UPI003F74F2FF